MMRDVTMPDLSLTGNTSFPMTAAATITPSVSDRIAVAAHSHHMSDEASVPKAPACSIPRNSCVPSIVEQTITALFSIWCEAQSSCPGMRRFRASELFGHILTQLPQSMQSLLVLSEKGPCNKGHPASFSLPT